MKYLLVLFTVLLCGCSVEISKIDGSKFKDKLSYFSDPQTGLCFAVVASRKTGRANTSGIAMANVPCERVPDPILK